MLRVQFYDWYAVFSTEYAATRRCDPIHQRQTFRLEFTRLNSFHKSPI